MNVFLSDFECFIEKELHLSTRVWISILDVPKLLLRGQTLRTKSAKKYYHVGTVEAFHLWSLAINVKVEKLTSCFPPIKLLDFLHVSTDGHTVKTPLILIIK